MRKAVNIIVIIHIAVLPAIPTASCERDVWDCPSCGRTGNKGNYCGDVLIRRLG